MVCMSTLLSLFLSYTGKSKCTITSPNEYSNYIVQDDCPRSMPSTGF
jgi:hypothetical protein